MAILNRSQVSMPPPIMPFIGSAFARYRPPAGLPSAQRHRLCPQPLDQLGPEVVALCQLPEHRSRRVGVVAKVLGQQFGELLIAIRALP